MIHRCLCFATCCGIFEFSCGFGWTDGIGGNSCCVFSNRLVGMSLVLAQNLVSLVITVLLWSNPLWLLFISSSDLLWLLFEDGHCSREIFCKNDGFEKHLLCWDDHVATWDWSETSSFNIKLLFATKQYIHCTSSPFLRFLLMASQVTYRKYQKF